MRKGEVNRLREEEVKVVERKGKERVVAGGRRNLLFLASFLRDFNTNFLLS